MDHLRGSGRTTRALVKIFESIPYESKCENICVYVSHNESSARCFMEMYLHLMSKVNNANFTANRSRNSITYDNGFTLIFVSKGRVHDRIIGLNRDKLSVVHDHAVWL